MYQTTAKPKAKMIQNKENFINCNYSGRLSELDKSDDIGIEKIQSITFM